MLDVRASLCMLPLLVAAPGARAAKALSVQFTISGTNGFNGMDQAALSLSKCKLGGTIQVISPGPAVYPCSVNSGSTLVQRRLKLTCTIGPDETVTLSGTLHSRGGTGKGVFSETFFKERGTYKAAPQN